MLKMAGGYVSNSQGLAVKKWSLVDTAVSKNGAMPQGGTA
jgi:hypothetical protein